MCLPDLQAGVHKQRSKNFFVFCRFILMNKSDKNRSFAYLILIGNQASVTQNPMRKLKGMKPHLQGTASQKYLTN